jgi:hypothetical protein
MNANMAACLNVIHGSAGEYPAGGFMSHGSIENFVAKASQQLQAVA